jgi:hypothetical protein
LFREDGYTYAFGVGAPERSDKIEKKPYQTRKEFLAERRANDAAMAAYKAYLEANDKLTNLRGDQRSARHARWAKENAATLDKIESLEKEKESLMAYLVGDGPDSS